MVDNHYYTVYKKTLTIMAIKNICQRNMKHKLRTTLDTKPSRELKSTSDYNLVFYLFSNMLRVCFEIYGVKNRILILGL